MQLHKRFPALLALIGLALGTGACFYFNTETAVKNQMEQKAYTPMSEMAELAGFPQAGQWRVLFRMTQGDWYDRLHHIEKGDREHVSADDRFIEHIFAYMPAGGHYDGLTPFAALPDSAVMNLNRDLEITELPGARMKDVKAACKARFYPYPEDKGALWYEVVYFELADGVQFVQLSRVPYAQLQPKPYAEGRYDER